MARDLVETKHYSCRLVCQLLDLPRSTFYYQRRSADEGQLITDLKQVAGQFPTYGTRRVTQQLRRSPYRYQLNRKRTQRLMRQLNLLRPVKRRQCRTTNSDHPYPRYPNLVEGLVVTKPDQVWASDITYIRLHHDFVYLAVVMDVFTRAIRGWCLSHSLDGQLTLTALRRGLSQGWPVIHHSDQGVQYAAHAYIDELQHHHIQISMAAQGQPEHNGYAERLMRTIKEEEVDLSDYQNFADAERQLGRFLDDVYMTKRIHSALGYLTPVEFEAAWRLTQPEVVSPNNYSKSVQLFGSTTVFFLISLFKK
jgi:putative transposase